MSKNSNPMMGALPSDDSSDEPEMELWSQDQLDYLLNTILPADSQPRFMGLAEVVAKGTGRSLKAVLRIAWGLCSRITSIDYTAGPSREKRSGKVTFADLQMIKWSGSKTKDIRRKNGPCDATYLSRILGRSVEDTSTLLSKHGPARGRKRLWE